MGEVGSQNPQKSHYVIFEQPFIVRFISRTQMPSVGRTAGGHRDPLTDCLQPIWLWNWPQMSLSFVQLQSDYKQPFRYH